MFKLENIKKLKTTLVGLSTIGAALLISGCAGGSDQAMKVSSVDGAVKYQIVQDELGHRDGPYYVNNQKVEYNNGRKVTPLERKVWDLDVRPDGTGLPMYDMKHGKPVLDENGQPKVAKGSVEWGEELYDAQCAMCHGEFGAGGKGYPTLAGGSFKDLHIQRLNPADNPPNPDVALKTIGSYWPYASTLYWYIQESMPFTAPKTLTNSETYAITAFLLAANGVKIDGEEMDEEFELGKENFHKVKLDNEGGFYPEVDTKDPHQGPKNMKALLSDPTIYGKGTRCMTNCIEEQFGKGKTTDDLLMKIKVDLAPNANEPISVERSWKEPAKAVIAGVDPVVAENYAVYCSACHANKAIGAPVVGDVDAWEEVMEKGLEEVYENGINGINAMPPMGTAMTLSVDEFKKMVDYMIAESK